MLDLSSHPQREKADTSFDLSWALAEILRLKAWLRIIANCEAQSSAERTYARRVRYIARKALDGERV